MSQSQGRIFSRIAGTGSYLPEKVLTNADLTEFVETTDEWIVARTGIRERHVAAEGETTSPDLIFPSSACLLQHKLGANGCPAFDVNAACSGFIYALTIADKFIQSGAAKTALVVGSETLTRMLDWSDRGTCVLFGDGAGAVVLKADGETGILSTHMHADGGKKELLWNPVGVSVGFKPDEKNAGVKADRTEADIDWLVPHQANLRIIEATAKRLEMPMERVIVTVDRHGNTSSGSVPLALDEAVRAGKIQRGQLVLLEAFGGGFTWGSALLRY